MHPIIHAIVFAACLTCAPRHDNDRAYEASLVTMYAGAAFDSATTVALKGIEGNPVLSQSHSREVVAVAGLTALSDVLTHYLQKSGHRRAATVMNFVTGGTHVAAGSWNIANAH